MAYPQIQKYTNNQILKYGNIMILMPANVTCLMNDMIGMQDKLGQTLSLFLFTTFFVAFLRFLHTFVVC